MRSTTRIAMSHSDEPRERRFENDSWPGVSMTSMPGSLSSPGASSRGSGGIGGSFFADLGAFAKLAFSRS